MFLALCTVLVTAQSSDTVEVRVSANARERARKLGGAYVLAGRRADVKEALVAETTASQAHRERVRTELASASLPEWAGLYYCGDGLGFNFTYCVAPQAGVYYGWTGCMGTYDTNYGSIESVDGHRLRVKFAAPPESNWNIIEAGWPRAINGDEWCFVPWGNLRYIVPTVRMIAFCNAVNSGNRIELNSFACRGVDGTTWRSLMTPYQTESSPLVPTEFAPFLLGKPVQCEIVATESPVEVGEYKGSATKQYQLTATVKCDQKDVLLPGMLLHVVDANPQREAEVVGASGDSARIEMRFAIYDALRDVPQVGWHLSTKCRPMVSEWPFVAPSNEPAASKPTK